METEEAPKEVTITVSSNIDNIIRTLVANEEVVFKSQQRGEAEPSESEKTDIALRCYENSKLNFLIKFGKHLDRNQLSHFDRFTAESEPNWEETGIVLAELTKKNSRQLEVKNRRYKALQQMIKENAYFSEIEMMKRNPLLYEQLVGQYLTADEKRERDKYVMEKGVTFVKILMEGIERDNAEHWMKLQQQKEDNKMEESESSDEDAELATGNVRWGEFEEDKMAVTKSKKRSPMVTAQERLLLRQEFVTTMYQNFLDGKDEAFDYSDVDDSAVYDNVEEIEHDAEDRYFDSEEAAEVIGDGHQSSEDELDIYMNALNQHPAVCDLAHNMTRL
ncbi:coiled-coil domain-containing protein 97 [Cylas formicarius]|uniref:coiled-coil domain-containing protein 97 n=1 Tax=Cylas formicarius TaxID=197179 RepID=UPI002958991B|nr:coiled-coil domain-containing protein 97 [Cylas formicarius]XP_060531890.1 coiled-coil domain-containing protein 97 [Cylas formicarius]